MKYRAYYWNKNGLLSVQGLNKLPKGTKKAISEPESIWELVLSATWTKIVLASSKSDFGTGIKEPDKSVWDKIWEESVETILEEVKKEYFQARTKFESFNTYHEGYAILLEELDELWEEIKKKDSEFDLTKIRKEAIQVSAMALAIVADLVDIDQTLGTDENE